MPTASEVLSVLMDDTGDGSGNHDSNVDGSGTPVVFKTICPGKTRYFIHSLRIHIADNAVIKPETYGGLTILSNGIGLAVHGDDDAVIYNVFNGHDIKSNNDFAGMGDVTVLDFGAGTTYGLAVHVDLAKAYGGPLVLDTGQYLAMTVNDNLEGLADHHFFVQGRKTTSGFGGS